MALPHVAVFIATIKAQDVDLLPIESSILRQERLAPAADLPYQSRGRTTTGPRPLVFHGIVVKAGPLTVHVAA